MKKFSQLAYLSLVSEEQILALEKVGCEIIRVAVENMLDAKAIRQIKDQINIPLVADES